MNEETKLKIILIFISFLALYSLYKFLLIKDVYPQEIEQDYISFTWRYTGQENDLAGFRIYSSKASNQYVFGKGNELAEIPIESLEYILEDPISKLGEGQTYFVVTCFDNIGNESSPSNEVTTNIDISPPESPEEFEINVKIKIIIGN